MLKRSKNLLGQRFGRLLVVEFLGYRHNGKQNCAWWDTQCDCGNKHQVKGSDLMKQHTASKSCGCLQREAAHRQGKSNAKPQGVAAFNNLYNDYFYNATQRNLSFNLSPDEADMLFKGNCHYCGVAPSRVHRNHSSSSYRFNGIDRLDNNIGYIADNCVSCCKTCNYMKRTMGYKEFLAHIKSICVNLSL